MHVPLWRRMRLLAALVVLAGTSPTASAALVDAIEYYHAAFDHYFVTASADEIGKLDSAFFTGWQRTGQSFKVADPGSPLPGGTPVCRFYGSPDAGLDSHFYSASPAECAAVQQKFPDAWLLESSNVFQVYLPDTATGACPAGSLPIYRAWNGRADSNHRYTTSLATLQSMVAKGYVAEGYGPVAAPVVMCSPTGAPPPAPVPQCSVTSNDTSPFVGATIALSATCSGAPTSYVWSGCSSAGASCLATSSAPGLLTYGVVASNANGSSVPATIEIVWRTPLPPPTCTLSATAESDPPIIGSTVLLFATCTNNPTSFTWSGCNSNTNSCYVSESASGLHTYTVTANNQSGAGTPASLTLSWSAVPPAAQDFCGNFPSVLRTSIPWSNTRTITASYPDPGFQWNGVWVVRFSVPAGTPPSSALGRFFTAEFSGPPVFREATLSRFACDFRAVDTSGNNGPLLDVGGISASGSFKVSSSGAGLATLQPGQTYYVNVRNRAPDGSTSCSPSQRRCDAFLDLTLPR